MHYHDKRRALIKTKSSAVDLCRACSEVPFKLKAFERGRFNDKPATTKSDNSENMFSLCNLTTIKINQLFHPKYLKLSQIDN